MKSLILESEGLKRKLQLTIPESKVEESFLNQYRSLQKKAKISGFRAGKVPLETLKKTYYNEAKKNVLEDLYKKFYFKALSDNQIKTAGPPTLIGCELEDNQDCKMTFELEVHPQVTVENYLKIKIKKRTLSVTNQDVEDTLKQIQNSFSQLKDSTSEGPVKKGDSVLLNLEAFDNTTPIKTLTQPDALIKLGDDTLAPQFDNQIIGLKLNEEKQFDFTFDQNHSNREIAGKALSFKIKIKKIKETLLPELTDEFAKKFKAQSIADLKEKIKTDITKTKEQKIKEEMENEIIEKLVQKNPLTLPKSLVKEHKESLKENSKKRMTEYGISKEEQEKFLKTKDSEFEKEAQLSLHSTYLVEKLIENLKIKTTEEDINKSLLESFPSKKPEEMKKELQTNKYWDHFILNLTRKKTIDYLLENAVLT